MVFPTEEDLLAAKDPVSWIDLEFLRQDPFAFASVAETYHETACDIARKLDVDRNGVFCIGSGAIGLSVNPDKVAGGHLKRYGPDSDLDMAIVSWRYFETAWRDLLLATQPHLREVDVEIEQNIGHQKKRLFDGAIITNKILMSLSFGQKWMASMDQISQRIAVMLDRNVAVNFWVYRDYWSLRNYVSKGLVGCQRKVSLERGR